MINVVIEEINKPCKREKKSVEIISIQTFLVNFTEKQQVIH